MILLFGGAYQGKLAYAMDRFAFSGDDVYRCTADNAVMPEAKKLICGIDLWILALVKADADAAEAVRRFIDANTTAVVICNDISGGVVPVDPVLRQWRETVGRSMAALSRASDEVIRLFCGIPTRLK